MCSERGSRSGSRRRLAIAALGASLALSGAAPRADEIALGVRPDTCVALHRGQTCYRRVTLSWTLLEPGTRYCLERVDGEPRVLACWRGNERREHRHDYASADRERYRLVRDGSGTALASASVATAWVYRKRRRGAGGWRLF